jgi:ubiquinone/menaquinone biosynthesis C-methylase UbiE
MLEQARNVCSSEIDLHLLDAEQDSFAANSFDCAILSLALHEKHPSSARTIYANCHRLLREQGALIIADFNPPAKGILGSFLGRCIIPLIEKCAGSDHYLNYSQWVDDGGLEQFLNRLNVTAEIISQPLHGNLLCCAVIKDDYRKITQQNFALLDLNLRHKIQNQPRYQS